LVTVVTVSGLTADCAGLFAAVPVVLVIPPVMVMVVVAFMRLNDTAGHAYSDHTQQKTSQHNTHFRHDEASRRYLA
jgi:hypothetical protein